ncbi:hypothetical protein CAPTEDRAFT_207721 [Capitella teleta]|uniref:SUEL-type lectin domain-containing protein n=1 Tax=Capitella teleta TaxID=283909 RepID=R7TBU2_CAPTE|nr:hypothetical protein CAPTEDRAFT_207721 [Capitella teleta]|eukprot:ELT91193.1 hypothetical protein CAPTEDRAFT_207721 [Capitella teleta]
MELVFLFFYALMYGAKALESVTYSKDVLTTVCRGDNVRFSCGQGQVVLMTSALYGRMASSTCIDHYPGAMDCSSNVLPQMDAMCSGRPNCSLTLTENRFGENNLCHHGYDAYLTVSYQCVTVQLAPKECDTFGKAYALFTGGQQGFLSSWVADQQGPGDSQCPWELHTTSDRTINITLFDFATYAARSGVQYGGCRKYVTIQEMGDDLSGDKVTVCGGSQRQRHVFLSQGRRVKITFHPGHFAGHFLLSYHALYDNKVYKEKDQQLNERFNFSILIVVVASVILGLFTLVVAALYVKLCESKAALTRLLRLHVAGVEGREHGECIGFAGRYGHLTQLVPRASASVDILQTKIRISTSYRHQSVQMKEINQRKENKAKEGLGGILGEIIPPVTYYQKMYEENTTTRKYSYVWDSLDEDTLNDICLGKTGQGKSNSLQDLPEVILVVDEEVKAKTAWKKAATMLKLCSNEENRSQVPYPRTQGWWLASNFQWPVASPFEASTDTTQSQTEKDVNILDMSQAYNNTSDIGRKFAIGGHYSSSNHGQDVTPYMFHVLANLLMGALLITTLSRSHLPGSIVDHMQLTAIKPHMCPRTNRMCSLLRSIYLNSSSSSVIFLFVRKTMSSHLERHFLPVHSLDQCLIKRKLSKEPVQARKKRTPEESRPLKRVDPTAFADDLSRELSTAGQEDGIGA